MPAVTRSASNERPSANADNPNGNLPPQRLILCFDGTGNAFQGNPGDTNIVKLYNMLDRTNVNQMHYYQPGIGTYPAEGPVNVSYVRGLMRKFEAILDQGFATSFDAHVIAGYRFIMRYYNPGDRIYVFGFSRGAFTARFLARMISHIGLLSRGNDEMVPFAYRVYQEYEQNRGDPKLETERANFMNSFKSHFCRTERHAAQYDRNETISDNESGIKVHFLGLFDCVNSVGTLDIPFWGKVPPLPKVSGTARYVRHAVAIDERRVKFKPALFAQERTEVEDDIKEVWFPGNHGDIGGGWSDVTRSQQTGTTTQIDKDYFQLSDIALKWMVDEIDDVESTSQPDANSRFAWEPAEKVSFLTRFQKHKTGMIMAKMHDTMKYRSAGDKPSIFKILFWNMMEWLPFIKRWNFQEDDKAVGGWAWKYIMFPLNGGGRRDIPANALWHHAVIARMTQDKEYNPTNNMWVHKKPWKRGDRVTDDSQIQKNDLDKMAEQCRKSLQPNGVAGGEPVPTFVYDEGETKASVVPQGATVEVQKPLEWDQIYRLELR